MVSRIQPDNPGLLYAPFDRPYWLFDLKHDGYCAVAHIEDGECELVSREQNVLEWRLFARSATDRAEAQTSAADSQKSQSELAITSKLRA